MTSPSAEIPEPEIEPCPWCGYAWPALVASTSDSSTVRVDCTCGASGIAAKQGAQRGVSARARAVQEWNSVAALRRSAEEADSALGKCVGAMEIAYDFLKGREGARSLADMLLRELQTARRVRAARAARE